MLQEKAMRSSIIILLTGLFVYFLPEVYRGLPTTPATLGAAILSSNIQEAKERAGKLRSLSQERFESTGEQAYEVISEGLNDIENHCAAALLIRIRQFTEFKVLGLIFFATGIALFSYNLGKKRA